MPYNGAGSFSPPSASFPEVPDTLIDANRYNPVILDLASGLTNAVTKDGQTTITANIPMNGFKMTNLGAATARTDSSNLGNLQDGTGVYVATVGGTADAITLAPSPAIAAYTAGQTFRFLATGTNTGAVTVAVSGLVTKEIRKNGATALDAADIVAGMMAQINYDGTYFYLVSANTAAMTGTVLTNATLAGTTTINVGATLTAPVLSGSVTGTYTLAGTPTLTSPTINTPTITSPTITGAGAGALVLIETKTASGSASLDFVTGLTSTYLRYELRITNLIPNTTNTDLWLRVSQDAGVTFLSGASDYIHMRLGSNLTSSSNAGSAGDTKIVLAAGISNATVNYALSGTIAVIDPAGTAVGKYVKTSLTYINTTPTLVSVDGAGVFTLNTSAIDGIQLLMSADTILSGTVTLYGVRHA